MSDNLTIVANGTQIVYVQLIENRPDRNSLDIDNSDLLNLIEIFAMSNNNGSKNDALSS